MYGLPETRDPWRPAAEASPCEQRGARKSIVGSGDRHENGRGAALRVRVAVGVSGVPGKALGERGWVGRDVLWARKLAVLCWHLLTRGEDYAFQRPSLARRKVRALERKTGAQRLKRPEP